MKGFPFATLEHSVDADSVVILRPKLSKLEKAVAIERAFISVAGPMTLTSTF